MKYAKVFLLVCFLVSVFASLVFAQTEVKKNLLKTYGLKINVDNMEKAKTFYLDKLGFEVEEQSNSPDQVFLKTSDKIKLILNKVNKLQHIGPTDTRVGLTLQVNDLDQAMSKMKGAGLDFGDNQKRKEGVGSAISFNDPFGRTISLMHQTIAKVDTFKEPKIYNYGVLVPDMDLAREFYSKQLGFVERTDKYLPLDMPLGHSDKTFGFMLHVRPDVKSIKSEYPAVFPAFTMVFETSDLQKAIVELKQNGVKILEIKKAEKTNPPTVVFEDPFGNISEVIEVK